MLDMCFSSTHSISEQILHGSHLLIVTLKRKFFSNCKLQKLAVCFSNVYNEETNFTNIFFLRVYFKLERASE